MREPYFNYYTTTITTISTILLYYYTTITITIILAEDPLFRKIGAVLGLFWNSPGLSWLPLGLSWNSSRPLGSSWAALGLSWTSLFEALGTKRQKDSSKVPQDSAQSCPRGKKGTKMTPTKIIFLCLFRGPFLDPLRNSLSEGFWDASCPKKLAFRLGRLSKTLLAPKSPARAKKARKDTKSNPRVATKPTQKQGSKMVPAKVVGIG